VGASSTCRSRDGCSCCSTGGRGGQVNLRRQAATGMAEPFPVTTTDGLAASILVIRFSPPRRRVRTGPRPPAGPGQCYPALRDGHRQRADERARPSRPLRPSMPAPGPHRSPGEAHPGSFPTSRPRTSAGAGCRRSSSARSTRADPATASLSASARTLRRPPAGDRPTGRPAGVVRSGSRSGMTHSASVRS
jgi:hypothetical protein